MKIIDLMAEKRHNPMRASKKEVFQPHLPVRLPCYDLALVASSALNGSFDGHRLQAYPTPMA